MTLDICLVPSVKIKLQLSVSYNENTKSNFAHIWITNLHLFFFEKS